MLVSIRDTLYEGSWEDFIADLSARAEGKPHIFDTITISSNLQDTIRSHLDLIAEIRSREESRGQPFHDNP